MKKIKIKVDSNLCIGAAACVVVDPTSFVMNDENKAYVLDHGQDDQVYQRILEVADEELDRILLAAESCPVLAVTVFDENDKQLFPKL